MVIQGGKRFQLDGVSRVGQVLKKHGYDANFAHLTDGLDRFEVKFEFGEHAHVIGVYEDDISMIAGSQLFEIYLRSDLVNESTFIESFAERLDRYLSGETWEREDGKGLFASLREKIMRLLGRASDVCS